VLYLAGLKGCDPSLEEAAAVDGANWWQRFWKVVMPQLRGVNTVVFAVTVIDSLRTFDIVWAMTQGGPDHSELTLLLTRVTAATARIVNDLIAEELERQWGVAVDKRRIELDEPLKTVGAHTVTVRLYPGVQAQLKVDLVEDK